MKIPVFAFVTFGLIFAATACQSGQDRRADPQGQAPAAAAATSTTADSGLRRVEDPSLVCMVNDQVMGRPQIPITVEGRMYYGCCENCKKRLAEDQSARLAKDPVTGAMVDKSAAVIGQDPSGRVFYFASEDSLRAFKSL
jgi:YHS domain-containing protein